MRAVTVGGIFLPSNAATPRVCVSACACARVQSRLNAAAAAAEFFSSVLRDVGIVSSLTLNLFVFFVTKYLNNMPESQHARGR